MSEILYFETVDRKVFFYTADSIYETVTKIYQLEEKLENTPFARISKTSVANLKKIRSIKPEANSRLCATLVSGEKLIVSRQYLSVIKQKLGVK
ncbi:MAG: LytTR family transcriptional regulator DNA-binding domain-containing protein [Clostridia bacterium]|nr:LytTR family transcriptional regulator DNA-binding domain-containing protein [Clostridia bacterium]